MSLERLFLRSLPRSLWAQLMLLLFVSILITTGLAAPFVYRTLRAQHAAELMRRGRAMVQTQAKDYELRLAISLKDAAQAAPVLQAVASGDEDVRYVLALKGHEVVAAAPPGLSPAELRQILTEHLGERPGERTGEALTEIASPSAQPDLLRFTQAVSQRAAIELPMDTEPGKPVEVGHILLGLSTARSHGRVVQQTFFGSCSLALLLFTVLLLFHFRWVALRLDRMVGSAQAIAAGELRQKLQDPVADDLGQLAAALGSMSERTADVIGQLVRASSALAGAAGDLFESSSRQAQSANQQAQSVTEMGATVAELRQTFSEATSKAESVIELARRSEESSSGGGAAVRESIDGMAHLRDQVQAIAQTIHGLLERTDHINTIIEAVNDLAEQSNVLALNAGIEAARAGEHGRGFAVVAREVRSLAERSKESTAEVRSILADIRQAGRDAGRVIEEGSRRAERGVALSNAAGESIQRLGDTIVASSASAMQIATLTRQQSVGIEQIWQATKGIDHAARETAQGIKQLEASAGELKALSAQLTGLVGRYKV